MRSKLYFYRNKAEFDQYYDENNGDINGFEIVDTKDEINDTIIDITDLILYVSKETTHRYSVRIGLNKINKNNKLIISSQYVDEALNIFPSVFEEAIPIYEKEEEKKILEKNIRHKIYYYNDYQFVDIEKECDKRKIILTNFANISIANNYDNDLIIDITSALQSMIGAEHIIYLLEQFFSKMNTKTTIIVDVCKLEDVKKFLKPPFFIIIDML